MTGRRDANLAKQVKTSKVMLGIHRALLCCHRVIFGSKTVILLHSFAVLISHSHVVLSQRIPLSTPEGV